MGFRDRQLQNMNHVPLEEMRMSFGMQKASCRGNELVRRDPGDPKEDPKVRICKK